MAGRTLLITALVLCAAVPGLALDEARKLSGVDKAAAERRLSGKGVLIAVMDRGLDLKHPAFRNTDGSSRVVGILDLTSDAGQKAPNNPHKFGTVYTHDQINAALAEDKSLLKPDDEGRGTASVGIACGNGTGSLAHRGVAPNAQILFVRLASDPSPFDPAKPGEELRFIDRRPQHLEPPPGGWPEKKDEPKAKKPKPKPGPDAQKKAPQSAEQFFGLHRLRVAIDYCVAQSKARKLPCVMLMNFAQLGGPTDGTSLLCQLVDHVTGPGKAGLVFVTGTSDKGDRENRTKGVVSQDRVTEVWVEKEAHNEVIVDVWYPGADRVDVRVTTPSEETFGPFNAPKWALGHYDHEFQLYHFAPVRSTHRPASGKRQIRVDLIGPPGRYLIELYGAVIKSAGGAKFDAFVSPNPENPLHEPFNHFFDPKAPKKNELDYQDPEKTGLNGSIWDGATARYAIAATCFVHRDEWKNIKGQDLLQVSEGKRGAIWRGAGRGPTTDGRHGVTVAVPADRIVTTYARDSEWASVSRNVISDSGGALYGMSSGTSAAASFLAGVVALMLERNPLLDAAQIKRLLTSTAKGDAFTGKVPNRTWGHGKLDAYAAISGAKPK